MLSKVRITSTIFCTRHANSEHIREKFAVKNEERFRATLTRVIHRVISLINHFLEIAPNACTYLSEQLIHIITVINDNERNSCAEAVGI